MSHIENKESGSKNKYDFDAMRNTGTLVGAIDYMLREFYFGEYASEIWHCFRMSDKYQPSHRFSWNPLVHGAKRFQVSGHILTDEEQIQASFSADKDKVFLNYILQQHHSGKSHECIQNSFSYNGYHPSEEIIQELITISEKRPLRHKFCEEKQEWQEELLPPLPTRHWPAVEADCYMEFTKTFLRGLLPMLQKLIYFGESTEKTRLVFLNLKRRFFSTFIQNIPDHMHDDAIPQTTYHMARGIVLLKFILQLHHIGKGAGFISHQSYCHDVHFIRKGFIREIIDIAKESGEGDPMRHKLREACSEKESDKKNNGE